MSDGLFDRIRTATADVAARAKFVRVDPDRDRIAAYAASLPVDQLKRPKLDPRVHYLGHGEATAAFEVILDTINFGSGYFPHLAKRPGLSGYFTIAARLRDYFTTRGTITAGELSTFGRTESARIFGQELNNTSIGITVRHDGAETSQARQRISPARLLGYGA